MADPTPPPNEAISSILFWTPEQQETGYRTIEHIFPTQMIKAGGNAYPLARASGEFDVRYDYQGARWTTETFMRENRLSGLLILQAGRIVLERYALGRTTAGPRSRLASRER